MPRSRLLPANKETASSIQPPFFECVFWSLRFGSVCVALNWNRLLFGFLGGPPLVVVNGRCDISAIEDAKVGGRLMRGERCGAYRRGCAVARGGTRGDDGARRQQSRCAGAQESDAPAPLPARRVESVRLMFWSSTRLRRPCAPRWLVLLFGRLGTLGDLEERYRQVFRVL